MRPAMPRRSNNKLWRLEAINPFTHIDWQPLWDIDEGELTANQELAEELNRINAPVEFRIVRNQ